MLHSEPADVITLQSSGACSEGIIRRAAAPSIGRMASSGWGPLRGGSERQSCNPPLHRGLPLDAPPGLLGGVVPASNSKHSVACSSASRGSGTCILIRGPSPGNRRMPRTAPCTALRCAPFQSHNLVSDGGIDAIESFSPSWSASSSPLPSPSSGPHSPWSSSPSTFLPSSSLPPSSPLSLDRPSSAPSSPWSPVWQLMGRMVREGRGGFPTLGPDQVAELIK